LGAVLLRQEGADDFDLTADDRAFVESIVVHDATAAGSASAAGAAQPGGPVAAAEQDHAGTNAGRDNVITGGQT
jgi:hypothetical protein